MQRKNAIKIYRWLWFAPFFTVPTIVFLTILFYLIFDNPYIGALLISSAWHIILVVQVLQQEDQYVRWHGKQALALAGLQAAIPLFYIYSYLTGSIAGYEIIVFVFPLGIVWLFGTLWGQGQAKQGVCSLMQLFGGEVEINEQDFIADKKSAHKLNADELENIIRFSKEKQKRAEAIYSLMELGMVETLDGSTLKLPAMQVDKRNGSIAPDKSGGCSQAALWVGGLLLVLFFLCRFIVNF